MSQGQLSATENTSSDSASILSINWTEVSRLMLKYSLPINPMSTQPDDGEQDGEKLYIALECIYLANQTDGYKNFNSSSKVLKTLQSGYWEQDHNQKDSFFKELCGLEKAQKQTQKIAIIGESGTGKSLCLQKIAHWMLEKSEYIPIWMSPSQLKTDTLQQYLIDKWLLQASKHYRSKETISRTLWQESFEKLLQSGKVWLLADGMDYLLGESGDHGDISPLPFLRQQLQEVRGNPHTLLTCQTFTWKMQPQALSKFDIYQTKSLSSQTEMQQFIQQWFHQLDEDLGEKLCHLLQQPDKQHLQTWLTTPLRLSLLCRLWQRKPQTFPQTAATLDQVLVDEFYEWQAETISTTTKQRQQLNQFLANLGLSHRQTEEESPTISQEMIDENESLLSLGLQLHWLRRVGIVSKQGKDNKYKFEDPTFEDYFASLAIDQWQYFLETDSLGLGIFSEQWQKILLFWLGREDIASEQKEALMQALVTFEDGCGQANFYGFKAYLTAVRGLSEFPDCSLAQDIIEQLFKWGFPTREQKLSFEGDSTSLQALAAREALNHLYTPLAVTSLINLIKNYRGESQQEQGLYYLEKLGKGNAIAIAALTQYLETTEKQTLRWQLAETLGMIDPGNQIAIGVFVELLETATTDQDYQRAFLGLEKIGQGDRQGVKALVRLLHLQPPPSLRRRTFQCLEIVAQENATAIAILVQLIRNTKDEVIRRQAAESLEKIDPGNPTAIAGLIKLMETASTQSIRQEAVYSLGEICPGNAQAITALVKLLEDNDDIYLRWIAISSLGKIAVANEEAIAILEKLIDPEETFLIRKEALDSLGKIAPENPLIIQVYTHLIEQVEDEENYREIAESLGKTDPGNPTSIDALTKILETSRDEFTLRQVAVSLGKIAPGNKIALRVLVHLIQSTDDPDIRSLAAESLGEIGQGNPAAIATLIRLLETSSYWESRRCAAKSLKIAVGNKEAISVFLKLLPTVKNGELEQQIADSLITILPQKQMTQVVTQLRDYLLQAPFLENYSCYRVIWHCAQHLSYQDFTEAWHQRTLPSSSLSSSQKTETKATETPTEFEQLQQQIHKHSQLDSSQIIWIETSRFIDPENPSIDIYDQMLEQGCSAFEHGLPETIAKLRLYWHLLPRNAPKTPLILLFYDDAHDSMKSNLSPHLLDSLAKFKGIIGVITRQQPSGLSVFSADHPQLGKTLLTWIDQISRFYKSPT